MATGLLQSGGHISSLLYGVSSVTPVTFVCCRPSDCRQGASVSPSRFFRKKSSSFSHCGAFRQSHKEQGGVFTEKTLLWGEQSASVDRLNLPSRHGKLCASPPACSKMFVPGFGDKSPEGKAADSLHNFFTYLAVKIVLAQLQAYNPEGYQDLKDFADRVPLKDGDRFCAELMRVSPRHKGLALRILEVRSAYAHEDFEWENMKKVSFKVMEDANTRLMRDFLVETSKWD